MKGAILMSVWDVLYAFCADQIHVSQGGHVGKLAKLVMEGLEGKV